MVAVKHLDYTPRGEAHHAARVTETQVECIRELDRLGYSTGALSRWYGIGERQVREIVSGRQWAHVPGVPRNLCATCRRDVQLDHRKLCQRCCNKVDETRHGLTAAGVVPPRRGVTPSESERMRELRSTGYSMAQIAALTGRGLTTVARHAGFGLPAGLPCWVAAIAGRTGETPEQVYERHRKKIAAEEGGDDDGR